MKLQRKYFFLVIVILLTLFLIIEVIPYLKTVYRFLGFDRTKSYLVLFQNNTELRPTGGFMGSYARVDVRLGKIVNLKVQDIYVPDGQIEGHVNPPWPIQAAFVQGWFKLRDSNWDPDFPVAAKTIEWFFEHGKERTADGIIAVNLTLPIELLKISGSLEIPDRKGTITAANFYTTTESAVEDNFFPGSIQKQSYLSEVARALFQQVEEWGVFQKLRAGIAIVKLAQTKQILLFSFDPLVEQSISQAHFDGSLNTIQVSNADYFSLFESNLGANKANCCVTRLVSLDLKKNSGFIQHTAVITFTNMNPASLKHPPQTWGGAYVDYLRVVLPISARVEKIQVGQNNLPVDNAFIETDDTLEKLTQSENDSETQFLIDSAAESKVDISVRKEKGLKILGFFAIVDALETKKVTIIYGTPTATLLSLQKQSGILSIPYQLSFGARKFNIDLDRDATFPIHL